MTTVRVGAERVLAAPAEIVYHCLADYVEHHRPGGFLPPAFTELQVERGGVGAGTTITFTTVVGGRPGALTAEVSEAEPGRVLVESSPTLSTTFTVDAAGPARARVQIDTQIEMPGVQGLVGRFLVPRLLRPIYEDELQRLEAHAQAHGPLP
jgi:polyketide cyclase/dehydrase/lipid transport protein